MRSAIIVAGLIAATLAQGGSAQTYWRSGQPCQPGYKLVEETCYREIVRCCCKVVPDVKKKTKVVYDCRCEPFCLPRLSCQGKHCAQCGSCDGCCKCESPPACGKVRNKTILMKKTITTECPSWKCVVEKVCERVPYKVYRMVPCDAGSAPPAPCLPPGPALSGREESAPSAAAQPGSVIPVSAAEQAIEMPQVHPAALPMGTAAEEPLMLPQTLPMPSSNR